MPPRLEESMTAMEQVHQLLHLALLEVRVAAHEGSPKKCFHLADLFHNVPLQLQRVAEGQGTYEEVLGWIRERAREKGCEQWVEAALAGAMTKAPPLRKSGAA
jgi:hypothetical protein